MGGMRSWQSEEARARCVLQHLGDRLVAKLNMGDVDGYRTKRFAEKTRMGRAPAPATLDKEVELLKRMLQD